MATEQEAVQTPGEGTFEFKAEIRQLLDILVHSLYTEREIFLRELISNASDALSRVQFEMLTNREVKDADEALKIHIEADKEQRLLRISDTGIGMTREELVENLGTIAHSGAREFIKAAEESGSTDVLEVIGRFGVGFYSVFMAAEWVTVTSRSYLPGAEAASWHATGADTYQLGEAEKETRGTTIEIKLREDAAEFADEHRLREIIRRHSDFVPYPIYLGDGDEKVNQQQALWRKPPREVEEEQYQSFYQQFTLEFEPPLEHIHLVADAPVQIYALLYIPASPQKGVFSLRKEDGLKLYSHNVMIQEYSRELLPEYMRFMQGVVDSEDLPLNVSRESVQSSAVIARLKKVLTGRVLSTLKEIALRETEKYQQFWERYGVFIKEGIAATQDERERSELYPLVRFYTTKFTDEYSSLMEYVGRMKAGQKAIYYILGEDRQSVGFSPHLDYFRRHGYEVITLTEAIDSFMLLGLTEFEGFPLKNVAAGDLELPEDEEEKEEAEEAQADQDQVAALIERFKATLGERVAEVRTTRRLSDSAARLVDPEGAMGQEMQRVYRIMGQDYEVPKKVLEINAQHPLMVSLMARPEGDELAREVIEQVYESALLVEGLHPEPASMINRIQAIMEAAVKK